MVSAFEQLPADRFGDLVRRVKPRLKSLLAKNRIPPQDAEDLLQETFKQLVYQLDRIRDHEAWLMGTLQRQCFMYWRTQRRRLYLAMDDAILEALSPAVEPEQEREQLLRDLQELIDRLPCRCQSLFALRRLGYEPHEIAGLMGYSSASIGKITTRCLADLRRELLVANRAASGGRLRTSGCGGCLAMDPEAAETSATLPDAERSRSRR